MDLRAFEQALWDLRKHGLFASIFCHDARGICVHVIEYFSKVTVGTCVCGNTKGEKSQDWDASCHMCPFGCGWSKPGFLSQKQYRGIFQVRAGLPALQVKVFEEYSPMTLRISKLISEALQ